MKSRAITLIMLLLAACGGGDDAPAPPAPPAVVAPSALSYTSPATATINVALTPLTPTVSNSPTSYSVSPTLPAGLTLNTTTGAISGTATVLADPTNYTVTATNSAGSTTFALSLRVSPPAASAYSQSNLVSNGAVPGTRTDARLVNPWGLAFGATSPSWTSNNVSNTSTLYDGTGVALATVVNIPAGLRGAAEPTGIVASASTTDFTITRSGVTAPARFIFSGEGGTITGWAPTVDATNAVITYDDGAGGARYQGLAIAANGTANTLYATDFKNRKIDVFDRNYAKITATGGFTDPNLPAGYSPYGIQAVALGTTTVLVVTYAQQSAGGNDAVIGAGLGIVNLFDLNGTLVRRLVTGGRLNAPWGVARAPSTFGSLAGMLLIGNFGDGVINGYDPTSGVFAGSISNSAGTALANPGLWGMQFGNGAQNQPTNTLYFTAGIAGETAGLYARIDLGATAPDVVAPTVAITAPAAAATISGTVTVSANATDNAGIAQVVFQQRVGTTTTTISTDTTAPYSASLDTTALANGALSLLAVATDTGGNVTTSAAIAVTVNNAPPPPTLATLQATIFTPTCVPCHNGVGAGLPGSMNLSSTATTFAALVNVNSEEVPALRRVLPGDPANSYLVHKVQGTQTVGVQMPLGGPPLSQANIDAIRAWIQAGAAP